jgi:hypothetical protein
VGETVFAVYENEVKVFVEDDEVNPGVFSVNAYDVLGEVKELFTVDPMQTTVYAEESTTKGIGGGFAITGREPDKTIIGDLLRITPSLTEFFCVRTYRKRNWRCFCNYR